MKIYQSKFISITKKIHSFRVNTYVMNSDTKTEFPPICRFPPVHQGASDSHPTANKLESSSLRTIEDRIVRVYTHKLSVMCQLFYLDVSYSSWMSFFPK